MIAILIVIITIILAVSGVSYLTLSSQITDSKTNAIAYNDTVGNEARLAVISSIKKIGETSIYSVPAAQESDNGWSILPDWLGVNAYSTNGVPFLYCPMSLYNEGNNNDKIIQPNGTAYLTKQAMDSNNHAYVTSSSYIKDNILAILISPLGESYEMPNCSDIELSNGKYIVPNGQAFVVSISNYINSKDSPNDKKSIDAYVTSEATNGNISGNTYQSRSLTVNINNFKNENSGIERMYIFLGGGDYIIDDKNLFVGTRDSLTDKRRELILVGDINNPPRIISNDGSVLPFEMNNISFELTNVIFDANIKGDGNNFFFTNSTIDSMNNKQTNTYLKDFQALNKNMDNELSNSTLHIKDNATFNDSLSLVSGSSMGVENANIIIRSQGSPLMIANMSNATISQSSISLYGGGPRSIYLSDSDLSTNNSIIDINGNYNNVIEYSGNLSLYDSNVNLSGGANIGLFMGSGSDTNIFNSNIFNRDTSSNYPSIAVNDSGETISVSGLNSIFSAGTFCWSGEMFETSINNDSSKTENTLNTLKNASHWLCN